MAWLLLPWLKAFLLTQLIEVPIWVRSQRGVARPLQARLGVGFGASAITHPIVWFFFPWALASVDDRVMVALAELFAWLVEWRWAAHFGVRRPLLWSAVANGASFSAGCVLYALDLL